MRKCDYAKIISLLSGSCFASGIEISVGKQKDGSYDVNDIMAFAKEIATSSKQRLHFYNHLLTYLSFRLCVDYRYHRSYSGYCMG